jgi:predicted porin
MKMKRNLIALAVGSAASVAMVAPAVAGDVTVYGRGQAELTSKSFQADQSTCGNVPNAETTANNCDGLEVEDNSLGRIGFKASEDLGNGWKGLAKFEYKVSTTESNGLTDRETLVGLKGSAVQIEAGQLKSAYKYAGGVKYDAFVTTALEARGNGGMSGGGAGGNTSVGKWFGHNSFAPNHLAVQGGSGPIKARLTYGPEAGDGSYTLSVMYKQGGIEAFVAAIDAGDLFDTGAGQEYSSTKLGGAFQTGPHKIMLQYEMPDDGGNNDPTFLFLAYNMKMGKNTFVVNIGQYDSDSNATPNTDTDYMALGVIHKFTKTTRIFGGFRTTDVDNDTGDDAVTVGLRKDF